MATIESIIWVPFWLGGVVAGWLFLLWWLLMG